MVLLKRGEPSDFSVFEFRTSFKCIHCLAPSPLATKINISCPLDMLLDSSRFYPSSTLGKKAFSYSAPRCWNALPRSLRIIPTLDTFKSQLKHFLFTNFTSYLHNVNPYSWCFCLTEFFSPFRFCFCLFWFSLLVSVVVIWSSLSNLTYFVPFCSFLFWFILTLIPRAGDLLDYILSN